MNDDCDGLFLPIKRRGRFKNDDYFKGFHDDFDSAIDHVMDKYGARSLLADQFSSYRKIRENQDEPDVAASISESNESYDIVIDMSDYVNGSLTVRTKGRNAIVEANHNSKTFHKVFPLPANTCMDAVKTAMSDEGILTITAPKKKQKTLKVSEEGDPEPISPLKLDIGSPVKDPFDESSAFSGNASSSNSKDTTGEAFSEATPTSPLVDKLLSVKRKGKFFEDPHFENVWTDFERAMDDMVTKENRSRESRKAEREARRANLKEEISRKFQEEMLPRSVRRDPDLDSALRDFGLPEFSRLGSYRNLRHWVPDKETQAVTVSKDGNGYKIVMDVKDIAKEGNLSVKASQGGLMVTGGKGESTTFKRRFSLPGLSDTSQVNACMSEDGILTITAPI